MKGKLIKTGDRYILYDEGGHKMATTSESPYKKLSLKNCQAIERDYDLDELVDNVLPTLDDDDFNEYEIEDNISRRRGFIKGFQKAIEILGDKKFSEDDIAKAYNKGQMLNIKGRLQTGKNYVKSLQKNEWDVIVETKKVIDETKIVGSVKGVKGSGNKINTYKSVPKLDVDGCLILKRI